MFKEPLTWVQVTVLGVLVILFSVIGSVKMYSKGYEQGRVDGGTQILNTLEEEGYCGYVKF